MNRQQQLYPQFYEGNPMSSMMEKSPLGVFQAHLAKGELAYQVCLDDNKPFFYPRAYAPATGSENIEWRVSKGLGTVYTTTAVHYKGEPPLNVAMIDLDEGFRMMSRVEDIDADYIALEVPDRYVYGYGMDYHEQGRNLPGIYALAN
jgi:uncharacterized OB-fold protein